MVTTSGFLFVTAFLASGVEVIEMMTILLGVGMTSGWRSTLLGAFIGLIVLAAIVAIVGPALGVVPLSVLRAVIGLLLLLFGVQWLRKGIRLIGAWGLRVRDHDELAAAGESGWTAFVIAFKGVLLEGLEIVFIVLAFGAGARRLDIAIAAALAAFAIVAVASVVANRVLRDIPGHVIKFTVGVLLVTYGTYWAAEGAGAKWPGEDFSILFILCLYVAYALVPIQLLRRKA